MDKKKLTIFIVIGVLVFVGIGITIWAIVENKNSLSFGGGSAADAGKEAAEEKKEEDQNNHSTRFLRVFIFP
ncbi:hypothetical protein CWI38_0520p0060 [Hamiltosporidium tvaerminnensis]|uniref:Uncharacterized protein n=1 Tax=Hamiltosporidium tvaerminnensis TaxID=1176355 RepID=A0A4Q9LXU2_9MICR|nr:hypothetical protein CWI38_0520p0060 [Hamiltosporidium tvaerminnensis]